MGVKGLWELLEPVGRRVNIETLTHKRLAVGAPLQRLAPVAHLPVVQGAVAACRGMHAHVPSSPALIMRMSFPGLAGAPLTAATCAHAAITSLAVRRKQTAAT